MFRPRAALWTTILPQNSASIWWRQTEPTVTKHPTPDFWILKNKNKFISNHRERMHDIYRSICWNKNANFLIYKVCNWMWISRAHAHTNCKEANIITQVTKLFPTLPTQSLVRTAPHCCRGPNNRYLWLRRSATDEEQRVREQRWICGRHYGM